MKLRKKINISVVCYALAYAMFVLSLFYKDVSAPEVLERVASVGKYASVGFLIVGALYNAYTKKQLDYGAVDSGRVVIDKNRCAVIYNNNIVYILGFKYKRSREH